MDQQGPLVHFLLATSFISLCTQKRKLINSISLRTLNDQRSNCQTNIANTGKESECVRIINNSCVKEKRKRIERSRESICLINYYAYFRMLSIPTPLIMTHYTNRNGVLY
jgi:hypothetical protein